MSVGDIARVGYRVNFGLVGNDEVVEVEAELKSIWVGMMISMSACWS